MSRKVLLGGSLVLVVATWFVFQGCTSSDEGSSPVAGGVLAAKTRVLVDVGPSGGNATVSIPEHAVEVTPDVFDLGTATDPSGAKVQGYMFIHRLGGFAKATCGNGICERGENPSKCPADCGGGGDPQPPDDPSSSCYGFLAREAKWRLVEPFVVNGANGSGLDSGYVLANLVSDVDKWETAAGTDILGDGSETIDALLADTDSPDDVNEVYFADVAEPGAIAITIVWGIFGGPPRGRKLVEWDQVYDDTDYGWSASGEAGLMDFENIATHELGHSVGMGDLYTSDCAQQTMYGYADYGETNKRDLAAGDIAGVQKLY